MVREANHSSPLLTNLQAGTTPLDFRPIICNNTIMTNINHMTDEQFDKFIDSKIFNCVDRGDSMFNAIRETKPELYGDDYADAMLADIVDINYWLFLSA